MPKVRYIIDNGSCMINLYLNNSISIYMNEIEINKDIILINNENSP